MIVRMHTLHSLYCKCTMVTKHGTPGGDPVALATAVDGLTGRAMAPDPHWERCPMSLYLAIPALIGIAFAGWCAGMLTFRRSLSWCRNCGASLKCPECQRAGLHTLRAGHG
jgi:hypothetical protein